jgi:hypothetical protein
MATTKDIFAGDVFAGDTFASGAFRGTGTVTLLSVTTSPWNLTQISEDRAMTQATGDRKETAQVLGTAIYDYIENPSGWNGSLYTFSGFTELKTLSSLTGNALQLARMITTFIETNSGTTMSALGFSMDAGVTPLYTMNFQTGTLEQLIRVWYAFLLSIDGFNMGGPFYRVAQKSVYIPGDRARQVYVPRPVAAQELVSV